MARMSSLNRVLAWLHQKQIKGRHRLHNVLARSAGTSPLIVAETKFGSRMLLNPYQYVDGFILRYGFYESEVFEMLQPYLCRRRPSGTSAATRAFTASRPKSASRS